MKKGKNYTVTICEDHILHNQEKVRAVLDRVSTIITHTYVKQKGSKK